MLTFPEISHVKTSITVLKRVNFHMFLNMLMLCQYIRRKKSDKTNYRSVNILPNLCKIYEKLMHQQLYEHFNSILSPKQCGFRKVYSAHHCLMVMLERLKESRDKGEKFGTFFTDLSKA